MVRNELDKLKERIWITERCHMKAEARNRRLEFFFHITLALFALSSIFVGLFQFETGFSGFDNILTFTSICTLSISLLIFGFKFGETAAQHRSCYLDLQRLRFQALDAENSLNEKYIDTLSYYPNHSTSDYMSVTISNIFSSKQSLKDSNGEPFLFSIFSRLKHAISWLTLRLLAVALALTPISLALISITEFPL
jgi:hypothetical protein